MGYIHEHTLVTVYRPTGKHAFASVGFPGLVGVLSGMNDAGLCVAVLEVYDAKDGEPHFNPKGIPYAMCHRRLLEECTTIAEAKKLLERMPRTSLLNLAVADRTGTAVFEVTPKHGGAAAERARRLHLHESFLHRRGEAGQGRRTCSIPTAGSAFWTRPAPRKASSASRTCINICTRSIRAS